MFGHRKRLVVIMGPTAVGKTACCISLAKRWGCAVVSADARQFYREMSIGTAKPTPEECAGVPHYFVDCLSVQDYYSAGLYEKEALQTIETLFGKQDTVLLSGGSGLYIKAVCEGLAPMPDIAPGVVQALEDAFQQKGLGTLLGELALCDPDYYRIVDRANHRKVMRALMVCRSTGKPFSYFRRPVDKPRPFEIIKIGLTRSRDVLRARIAMRVEAMVIQGLVAEAKKLHCYKDYSALQTIGYQELFGAFEGLYSIEEAIRMMTTNTCRYMKRQMSWLRQDGDIRWFSPEDTEEIAGYVEGVSTRSLT